MRLNSYALKQNTAVMGRGFQAASISLIETRLESPLPYARNPLTGALSQLLREVILVGHFFDRMQLAFQEIYVMFFVF